MADVEAPPDADAMFDQLVALCEPARRDLYFYVVSRRDWVSRAEAADALGLRHGLAAHHLDRLADDGLLEVQYRRLTGRTGPGAGRPAKLYRRAPTELALSIPPRNSGLVGRILIDAIARAGDRSGPVMAMAIEGARDAGRAAASRVRAGRSGAERRRAVAELLDRFGYGPRVAGGELTLENCPYAPLSEQNREVVCGMNLAFVEGAVEQVGIRRVDCSLAPPADGGCCVHVSPWPSPPSGRS